MLFPTQLLCVSNVMLDEGRGIGLNKHGNFQISFYNPSGRLETVLFVDHILAILTSGQFSCGVAAWFG